MFIQNWLIIISAMIIYAVVGWFLCCTDREKEETTKIVRLGKSYLVTGIVCTIAFFIAMMVLAIREEDYRFILLFVAFSCFSCSLILAYFNCRFFYDADSVTYRNFFGKKTTILYSEITDVDIDFDIYITSNDKKIKIYNYMVGASQLLAEISPFISPVLEMKKQNISPQPKVIKFRDAVHRPGEFIFCFVAMFLMGVFGLFLMFWTKEFHYIFIVMSCSVWAGALLTFYSAKRAHSSKFWYAIAKLCYKEGYLKVDDLKENSDNSDMETRREEEEDF